MNLLTELSNVFTEADDTLAQIGIDEEKKIKIMMNAVISWIKLKDIYKYIVEKEKHQVLQVP